VNIIYATDQYWPRISGMAVSVDAFKDQLEKMGHKVYIFAPAYPGSKEIDAVMMNQRVFRFRSYGIFFSPEDRLVYPFERKKIYNILDYIKPDIIHTHTEFSVCKIVGDYAIENKKPLIMTAHTNWEELVSLYVPFFPDWYAARYSKRRLQRTYNRADCVVVPTLLMKDLLTKYEVTKPLEIIPTGIDPNDFAGVDKKRDKKNSIWYEVYPALKGRRILLSAGRIGKEKNLPFLVDVLEKLVKDFPDILLVFVGDGPFRGTLEKMVENRGLSEYVLFTGFIVRSHMKDFFSIADIFVFASKVESQGLVTIESMLCRTPVVAIGEMGTSEIMNGDNGGYMVKNDVDEFTDKVRILLSDKKIYKEKSEEAFKYAEKWTIKKNAVKMLKLYKKFLKI
jgi:glycosyltransferase involved in cell wall biosynthesis